MNKKLLTTLSEVIGFAITVFGVSILSVPAGIIAFGVGLIALGGLIA